MSLQTDTLGQPGREADKNDGQIEAYIPRMSAFKREFGQKSLNGADTSNQGTWSNKATASTYYTNRRTNPKLGSSHPYAPRIEKATWNQYKPVIEGLAKEKDLPQVVEIMKKEHGFVATKSQYRYRLLIWRKKMYALARKKAEPMPSPTDTITDWEVTSGMSTPDANVESPILEPARVDESEPSTPDANLVVEVDAALEALFGADQCDGLVLDVVEAFEDEEPVEGGTAGGLTRLRTSISSSLSAVSPLALDGPLAKLELTIPEPEQHADEDLTPESSAVNPAHPWSSPFGSTLPSSVSAGPLAEISEMGVPAETQPPEAFYNYSRPSADTSTGNGEEADDEVNSIVSLQDDIASLAGSAHTDSGSEQRSTAVDYIVKALTEDPELFESYQYATTRLRRGRFVRNHCTLLKRYYLGLQSEWQSPSQKLAAAFLGCRSGRVHISREIYRYFKPADGAFRERIQTSLDQNKDKLPPLDRFLGEQDNQWEPPLSEVNDTECGDAICELSSFKLEETARFLVSGQAFVRYKQDLRSFLSPTCSVLVAPSTVKLKAEVIATDVGKMAGDSNRTPRIAEEAMSEGERAEKEVRLPTGNASRGAEETMKLGKKKIGRAERESEFAEREADLIERERRWRRDLIEMIKRGGKLIEREGELREREGELRERERELTERESELTERERRWTRELTDQRHQQPYQIMRPAQQFVAQYWAWAWAWAMKATRPTLKDGYRRLEWKCDCGDDLYADFPDVVDDGGALDRLLSSLQNPAPQPDGGEHQVPPLQRMSSSVSSGSSAGTTGLDSPAESTPSPCGSATSAGSSSLTSISRGAAGSRPKFLALCVNTGGIYKTLAEIEALDTDNDLTAFRRMKEGYLKTRGVRTRFSYLVRPIGVEFVHFSLWSRRRGYLSVCDRPNSIPPLDSGEYEYAPKPLKPLVPMPPEIFIHYLGHGEGDLNPRRNDWLPRLPKRLDRRVIDDCGDDQSSPGPCFGWGMHVIEGPNRGVIAGMAVLAVLVGIVTSAIWSAVRGDVQGGFAIGAMIVALPPVALMAVVFRLEGV